MLDESQYRIANKSRQIGFTTECADEIAFYGSRGKGEQIVILSKNDKAAQEFLRYVRQIITSVKDKDPDFTPIKGRMTKSLIEFVDGSRIQSLAATPETGRSISASRIYFDEMAFTPWVDDIFQAIEPTISQTGGKMTAISTPKGRGNLFAKIIRNAKDYGFSLHQYEWWWNPLYNPYLAKWLVDRDPKWIAKAREGAWYKSKRKKHSLLAFMQEFECSLDADTDSVYSQKQLDRVFYSHHTQEFFRHDNMLYDVWWQKPRVAGHKYASGVDLGRKRDATVLVTYDVTVLPAEMVEYIRIAPGTADWSEIILTVRNTYAYYGSEVRVDSTGAGDVIAEGLTDIAEPYIISANQSAGKKYNLIENSRRAYDNGVVLMPKVEQLYSEHEKYSWNDKTIVQDSIIANCIALSIFYDPETEGLFLGADPNFSYVEE